MSNEKINSFLKTLKGNSKEFFECLIENCNIEEMIKPEIFEAVQFKYMQEEKVTVSNKDIMTSVYMVLLKDYCVEKLMQVGNETYILTDNGWVGFENISFNDWDSFMKLIIGSIKLSIQKMNLIINTFLKLIQKSNDKHNIIQLKNKYIDNGIIVDGFYNNGLSKIYIKREITNNIKCDTALDLISHLCNYDKDVSDWFLNQIASSLILNRSFKAKNGQLIRLFGSGENGKSTFTKFLRNVFNEQNIYSIRLDDIGKDSRYDLPILVNSLFVIDEDATETFYKPNVSSMLKTLVTGEKMSVREIYGKPIQTYPISNIIVASNHSFKSDDKTDGIHRRITEIKTGGKLKRDNDWFRKLYSEKECQAFFNLCIERMKALSHDFNEGKNIEIPISILNRKQELARENNNVLEFIELFSDEIENYSVAEVREKYELWCKDNDLNSLGKTKFNETIENKLGLIRRTMKGIGLKGDSYDKSLLNPRYIVKAWIKEEQESE